MEARFGAAIVGLLIVVGMIWWNSNKADADSWDIHDEIVELLNTLPDIDTHGSLYMDWFETHHEAVFADHYTQGGPVSRRRYRSAEFDADGYLYELLTAMIGEAVGAGYEQQAEHLRELRETAYWEE